MQICYWIVGKALDEDHENPNLLFKNGCAIGELGRLIPILLWQKTTKGSVSRHKVEINALFFAYYL